MKKGEQESQIYINHQARREKKMNLGSPFFLNIITSFLPFCIKSLLKWDLFSGIHSWPQVPLVLGPHEYRSHACDREYCWSGRWWKKKGVNQTTSGSGLIGERLLFFSREYFTQNSAWEDSRGELSRFVRRILDLVELIQFIFFWMLDFLRILIFLEHCLLKHSWRFLFVGLFFMFFTIFPRSISWLFVLFLV